MLIKHALIAFFLIFSTVMEGATDFFGSKEVLKRNSQMTFLISNFVTETINISNWTLCHTI